MDKFAYLGMGITGMAVLLFAYKAATIALAIWYELAYPGFCARVHGLYTARKRLSLVVGLVNSIFFFIIVGVLFSVEGGGLAIPGFTVIGIYAALSVAAYGAAYRDLGQRLDAGELEFAPVRALIRGGILVEIAFLVPLYGQAMSLYTLFRGLGAVIIALLTQRRHARAARSLGSPED
ncbi:MAG: hypothetical protein HYV27_21415 [Candidatus Hydrogenedentes bacterium]|nr:hypothetical protein [Candidatus Hydrogenedentota bacterium]